MRTQREVSRAGVEDLACADPLTTELMLPLAPFAFVVSVAFFVFFACVGSFAIIMMLVMIVLVIFLTAAFHGGFMLVVLMFSVILRMLIMPVIDMIPALSASSSSDPVRPYGFPLGMRDCRRVPALPSTQDSPQWIDFLGLGRSDLLVHDLLDLV